MKREYRKPYLAVESFQLDAAIAGACKSNDLITLNHTINNCTLEEEIPGEYLFGQACSQNITLPENSDKLCYQSNFIDATAIYLES